MSSEVDFPLIYSISTVQCFSGADDLISDVETFSKIELATP